MKILIVDDNKNNRMIIRLLLEDYQEDNNIAKFDISEAEDGLVALNMAKENHYNLIFMDIMMPNMDGIEATKAIRAIDSSSMIIAVSAVDDGERKKLILHNGAEDYISKPINSDIFVNRVANYRVLIEARNHKKDNKANINLFTTSIYNRHTKFILNSEDSLAEFWEFFLLNSRLKSDAMINIVRAIISIVEKQMKISNTNMVYIEDSEDIQYFTLTGISALPIQVIKLLLAKNSIKNDYQIQKDKISFRLSRLELKEDVEEYETINIKSTNVVEKIAPIEEVSSPISFESSRELVTFDYLEDEDLYDLEEYAGKLSSILLIVGSGDVTEEEVSEIYAYLDKLSSILSTYSEVYVISKALAGLSVDMATYTDVFIKNSEALGPMCKAFSNDMLRWIEMSFHTGAPSIDFMNDTIVVNCQTIAGMLKMDESPVDDDFDDIFDF